MSGRSLPVIFYKGLVESSRGAEKNEGIKNVSHETKITFNLVSYVQLSGARYLALKVPEYSSDRVEIEIVSYKLNNRAR